MDWLLNICILRANPNEFGEAYFQKSTQTSKGKVHFGKTITVAKSENKKASDLQIKKRSQLSLCVFISPANLSCSISINAYKNLEIFICPVM